MSIELTQESLQELIEYNPDTGEIFWKQRSEKWFKRTGDHRHWNARFAGKKAGAIKRVNGDQPYALLRILNRTYRAHRVVWLLVYGYWPDEIDHINGNGLDNRLSNLRNVTRQENTTNKPLQRNNKSGVPGVYFDKKTGQWRAQIGNRSIGYFRDKFNAICARKSAEAVAMYHPNHGRR